MSWGCGDVGGEMAVDPRISQGIEGIVPYSRSAGLAAAHAGQRRRTAVNHPGLPLSDTVAHVGKEIARRQDQLALELVCEVGKGVKFLKKTLYAVHGLEPPLPVHVLRSHVCMRLCMYLSPAAEPPVPVPVLLSHLCVSLYC